MQDSRGQLKMENGKWKIENGKWKMESGKCMDEFHST
jgi:hypothetical protein